MQILMTGTNKATEVVFLHGVLMLLGFFPAASKPVEKYLIESIRISQWRQGVFFI